MNILSREVTLPASFLSSPLAVNETWLLQFLIGVCACVLRSCMRSFDLSEFARIITSTFMQGFQNNLALFFSP